MLFQLPKFLSFNQFIDHYKTKNTFSENLTLAKILQVRRERNNYIILLGEDPFAAADARPEDAMAIEFIIREKRALRYLEEYRDVCKEGDYALVSYHIQGEEFSFHAFLPDISEIVLTEMRENLFMVKADNTRLEFIHYQPFKPLIPSFSIVRLLARGIHALRRLGKSSKELYKRGDVAGESSVILPSAETGIVEN